MVTMLPANHCPGSSLFLFEKITGRGNKPKTQRVLHCGDFRACRAHIEHPHLRPDIVDTVNGKTKEQKLDVCYLDTTYLNPKYAFPTQEDVIKACADMCISLSREHTDRSDDWETMKRERAGSGMIQFLENGSKTAKQEELDSTDGCPSNAPRGRLLVVVGTYSIGKERMCLGIAKALNSKIYAPPAKQRICACLEDSELMSRLTLNPREAQVHMTPLFEIRAETLDEYLKDFRDAFTRAVGFRPTGWNYRPPNSRFVESPSVQTVLYSQNWKSNYSMRELIPQRGSTKRVACFGVPYSEHSSFRELTMFCCALRIERIIPTVNVGSAKSRERMRSWVEKWAVERRKGGLFKAEDF
jgi:DNA cross-link repair 1A protein